MNVIVVKTEEMARGYVKVLILLKLFYITKGSGICTKHGMQATLTNFQVY